MTWPLKDFLDLVTDRTGGQPKIPRSAYEPSGQFPIIDQGKGEQAGFTSDRSLLYRGKTPLLLFGDHTREVKHVDGPFALGADGVKALEPAPGVAAKFLYYFLLHDPVAAHGYSRHFKFLKEKRVPLPPLPEQHRIVEILDQAEALRLQRREADEIARSILPALFHEMFGDAVRNSKDWPTSTIGKCTDSRLGKMLDRGKDEESDPQPYLANLNVRWGEFDLEGLRTMDFSESDRREFELKPGDVLVCEGGEVGRSAIWRTPNSGIYFQKALHRVRVDPQKLTPEYFQFFLYSMAMNGGLTQHVGNSIIGHLTGVKLKQLTIPLPPLELQRRFSVEFLALEGLSARFSSSSATLETLFQTLLHRAFDGSLTAKWREAHAKELLQEMEHQAR